MSEERLNELFSIVNEGYSSIQEREIRDYITNLQQENKQLKEKVNKLEILIENLKLGVTLNQEQEDLLDKVLFGDDSNE